MYQIASHGKINLYLRVVKRWENGFHQLETLFQEINLCDQLYWQPGQGRPTLDVIGADLGEPEENLVMKAVKRFSERTGIEVGGQFRVEKQIPAGGGLGGGSSNGAATLKLLNRHYEQPLTDGELHEIAAALGSDVPFFLEGGCQIGHGRGTELSPYEGSIEQKHGYLFFPEMGLPTGGVFSLWEKSAARAVVGENDLLEPALKYSSEYRTLYNGLEELLKDGCFFMTGSGSTMVWLTKAEKLPEPVEAYLKAKKIKKCPFSFLTER